jgi:hypothetical protein
MFVKNINYISSSIFKTKTHLKTQKINTILNIQNNASKYLEVFKMSIIILSLKNQIHHIEHLIV